MKKTILAAIMAFAAFSPAIAADDDKPTYEGEDVMIVKLLDGNETVIALSDIENVTFGDMFDVCDFVVYNNNLIPYRHIFPAIAPVFRQNPATTGEPTIFGFGTAQGAEAPEALTFGDYGVILSISPSKLFTENLNLATETSSYTLTLLRYEEGAIAEELTKVTSGTLTTRLDHKTAKVTIDMRAVFDDHTIINVNWTGKPVDVESLEGMTPAPVYANEAFYYNADGNLINTAIIESVTKASKTNLGGSVQFTFNFADGTYINGLGNGKVTVKNSIIEQATTQEVTLNLADGVGVELSFGSMQLFSIDESDSSFQWKNICDNGLMTISSDSEGNYHIFIDVVNTYTSYMGSTPSQAGNPERLILNYEGPVQ